MEVVLLFHHITCGPCEPEDVYDVDIREQGDDGPDISIVDRW